jgi:hypothetical protein
MVKVNTSRNSETALQHTRVKLNGREPFYRKPHGAEYNTTTVKLIGREPKYINSVSKAKR